LFDAERRTLQVNTRLPGFDPFDARIAAIVVHDLGGSAPVRRVAGLAI
jgi:hypothetical protein